MSETPLRSYSRVQELAAELAEVRRQRDALRSRAERLDQMLAVLSARVEAALSLLTTTREQSDSEAARGLAIVIQQMLDGQKP